ncbi:D(4) dopamine receptor-like [Panicum virgatum]|uniref:D(4) dopamine receptor-like n=1 Tax=Panicum virgatum TaxID=38727 RepID=UPI0019D5885C|nr:D(4) dopamine receptor-like [Panicum virgatum]
MPGRRERLEEGRGEGTGGGEEAGRLRKERREEGARCRQKRGRPASQSSSSSGQSAAVASPSRRPAVASRARRRPEGPSPPPRSPACATRPYGGDAPCGPGRIVPTPPIAHGPPRAPDVAAGARCGEEEHGGSRDPACAARSHVADPPWPSSSRPPEPS